MKNSRRQFVKRSLAAVSSLAAALPAGFSACTPEAPDRAPSQKIIDVHIHANFSDHTLQEQSEKISRVDFSIPGLREEMNRNYIERAFSIGFETRDLELSQEAQNPMLPKPADSPVFDRIHPIGGINPYDLDREGLTRIDQALKEKQLKGLKIYLGYYHFPPTADQYKRVYELAARHQVPVMFHTGDTYSQNAKVQYAHPLPIDSVAVDFRQVTFILAHLGNPWTMDCAELMYKNPNVYADLSGFFVADKEYFSDPENADGIAHAIERIRQAFAWVENPEKFLYGSDWPVVPMGPYIEFIKTAIEEKHHQQVFYDNASKVFKL